MAGNGCENGCEIAMKMAEISYKMAENSYEMAEISYKMAENCENDWK
jgi:hypothetical protein